MQVHPVVFTSRKQRFSLKSEQLCELRLAGRPTSHVSSRPATRTTGAAGAAGQQQQQQQQQQKQQQQQWMGWSSNSSRGSTGAAAAAATTTTGAAAITTLATACGWMRSASSNEQQQLWLLQPVAIWKALLEAIKTSIAYRRLPAYMRASRRASILTSGHNPTDSPPVTRVIKDNGPRWRTNSNHCQAPGPSRPDTARLGPTRPGMTWTAAIFLISALTRTAQSEY